MTANFPGPDLVELLYSVQPSGFANITHRANLNCELAQDYAPGTAVTAMNVLLRSGSTSPLNSALSNWAALMDNVYNSSEATIIGANIWRYTPQSYERTFISSYSLGVNGASGTSTNVAWQNTLTFKTQEGGEMRLVFLESVSGLRGVDNFPFVDASFDAIADFVISANNWILGKDTSYPIAAFNHLGGENERVFKKRYRV